MLFNNSHGTVVDWGPSGITFRVCSRLKCSDPQSLREQLLSRGFPKIIKSPFNISIFWKDKVLAPPQLRMIKPIRGLLQKALWKVALSLGKNKIWKGNYTKDKNKKDTFIFEKTQMFDLQVCLKIPFVFLLGKFTINPTLKVVECPQCRLFTCLNSSIYNPSQNQIMILKRRRGLWIPIQVHRVWEGSPIVHVVLQLHKILHRKDLLEF